MKADSASLAEGGKLLKAWYACDVRGMNQKAIFNLERSPTGKLLVLSSLARIFHELVSRDREDGRATGQPSRGTAGLNPRRTLYGTSQGTTPEDARKDGNIRGRSKRFMKYPG
jgi:hypothetical protein